MANSGLVEDVDCAGEPSPGGWGLVAGSWERAQPGNLKVKGVHLIAESITPKWSKSRVAKQEVQRGELALAADLTLSRVTQRTRVSGDS